MGGTLTALSCRWELAGLHPSINKERVKTRSDYNSIEGFAALHQETIDRLGTKVGLNG